MPTTLRDRSVLGIPEPARGARAMLLVGLVVLGACSRQAGTRNLQRPPDCKVDVLPNPPGPDYVEIGELQFEPYIAGSSKGQYKNPYALAADLRPDICAVGGDTLVTERNAAGVIVAGTVFRRADVLDVVPPHPRPPPRAEGCAPSCRGGFTCEAGACVPACVPACGDGATCGSDGLCHPDE